MYIVIPHKMPPHWGHDCVRGTWDCEADCPGCRDRRDSYCCLGDPETTVEELAELVRDYNGLQALALRDHLCNLVTADAGLLAELRRLGVDWAEESKISPDES